MQKSRLDLVREVRAIGRWLYTIDALFSHELVRVYGRKYAGDARYNEHHIDPRLDKIAKLYRATGKRYSRAWQAVHTANMQRVRATIAGV
jgi:hypothetical protein